MDVAGKVLQLIFILLGEFLSAVDINASLNNEKVKEVSEQCMQYSRNFRPVTLKNAVTI